MGMIGDLSCDDDGVLIAEKHLKGVSLMGLHSIYGRSIVVS